MASFDEHISQAKKNLTFLTKINKECNNFWDWQVTACFYTAVHLANSHIALKSNSHYRTHSEVKNALNPATLLSPSKFNEMEYTSYVKLMNLSRRARYLCHESESNKTNEGQFTYDRHFIKALKSLDKILKFFSAEYRVEFDVSEINCILLQNNKEIEYFEYLRI